MAAPRSCCYRDFQLCDAYPDALSGIKGSEVVGIYSAWNLYKMSKLTDFLFKQQLEVLNTYFSTVFFSPQISHIENWMTMQE